MDVGDFYGWGYEKQVSVECSLFLILIFEI